MDPATLAKSRIRAEGDAVRVVVDLDTPLPASWVGRVGFNLELFPVALFGHTWYVDGQSGIFPRQAGGPSRDNPEKAAAPRPMAVGRRLAVAPESDAQRLVIESNSGDLALYEQDNVAVDRIGNPLPMRGSYTNAPIKVLKLKPMPKLDAVKVGELVLNNVDAAVVEGDKLPIALLGMSFLNRMEMKRAGDTLTLIQRY